MIYTVHRIAMAPDDVTWATTQVASVGVSLRSELCEFETSAQLLYDDKMLYVHFKTNETNLRAVHNLPNSMVCEDSCMEFFVAPYEHDGHYFNFEINPIGTMLLYKCLNRDAMTPVLVDHKTFHIKTVITQKGWDLYYQIPFAFFENELGGYSRRMRGNFYKCGEKTSVEHYATWCPLKNNNEDFHDSASFGDIVLMQ